MSELAYFLLARAAEDNTAAGEAMRKIVKAYLSPQPPWWSHNEDSEWLAVEWVMRCLALPYAAHPDYREEFKP